MPFIKHLEKINLDGHFNWLHEQTRKISYLTSKRIVA